MHAQRLYIHIFLRLDINNVSINLNILNNYFLKFTITAIKNALKSYKITLYTYLNTRISVIMNDLDREFAYGACFYYENWINSRD